MSKYGRYIPKDLITFINNIVSEYYPSFDTAHGVDHSNDVVRRGLEYAKEYSRLHPNENVNMPLVFVACALHDIGLSINREEHHIHSARIIDKKYRSKLLRWFTDEEIDEIMMAVEDHRASKGEMPRSLYGRIVSQADRNVPRNTDQLIRRSVKWTAHHLADKDPIDRYNNIMSRAMKTRGIDMSKGDPRIKLDIPTVRSNYKRLDRLIADENKVSRAVTKAMINNGLAPKGWSPER